jgi:tetratricopeptide (TPR) repeat protein
MKICCCVLLLVGCGMAQAQMPGMGAMPMDGMVAIPPPEQLPVPVKMTGIGNSHIAIKAGAATQAWFDQGLTLLHDFWEYESAKAFEQAIRTDPNCAMCWWGLAQAEGFRGGPDEIYSKQALKKAVELKGHGSATDKLYIEAATAGAADGKDGKAGESEILRKLVKKDPRDIEARIYLANSLGDGYDETGEPKAGTRQKIAMLEAVLKDAPNDSAANHYWIHAMEPSNHPERAIGSAALLASLAPASGHMVHMPGHIYFRVGDYADADKWFSASTAADEKYMAEFHVGPDDDWNYTHNMMFGIANLMEQGRMQDANALSDRLGGTRGRLAASLYVWNARHQMARVGNRLPVAMRVGNWTEVLAILDEAKIQESERTTNLLLLTQSLREYAYGMRALDQGDVHTARLASDGLDAGLWRAQQDAADKAMLKKDGGEDKATKDSAMAQAMPDAEQGPLVKALSVASLELRACILVGQRKVAEAKKVFDQAIAEDKKAGYAEPPFYIRPVAETEALALIAAKDYTGAKTAYEAALVERPQSGFELYGLAHVAELQGDLAGAKTGYAAFLKAWPSADAGLPEVVHAKAAVGQ